MAIKLPDPGNGIPEQKTGNDEWTNMKIVRDNFADQSNAASRLVGTSDGQVATWKSGNIEGTKKDSRTNFLLKSGDSVPENSVASRLVGAGSSQIPDNNQALTTALTSINYTMSSLPKRDDDTYNIDELPSGTRVGAVNYTDIVADPANSDAFTNKLIGYLNSIDTYKVSDRTHQVIKGHYTTGWAIRRTALTSTDEWTPLVPISSSEYTYRTTTATTANVVVGTDGVLRRASSSEKYKDILADLELDDEAYSNAMQVKPIIYRSKSDVDPQNWHFLSFSAEKLGEYDPALTQWRTHETDPETGERIELEKKEAEGINLNAICAVLHATNIYQDKKLKELEKRLSALEG